jgi:hypothetical protein
VVRIGDLVQQPTILVIPRYYGCLPCRDYLNPAVDDVLEDLRNPHPESTP